MRIMLDCTVWRIQLKEHELYDIDRDPHITSIDLHS